jgi:acyl-coenzyme A thioesterase PaaI-like protein
MSGNLIRKVQSKIPVKLMRHIINCYKPFRGAGIKLAYVSDDYRKVTAKMPLKWNNRNYFGTQYGGSLFSMTDSFYAIMLSNNLGRKYIVWDVEATIKFIKPGRTEVKADFSLSQDELDHVIKMTESGEKFIFEKSVQIFDKENDIVAEVFKKIYIRKK